MPSPSHRGQNRDGHSGGEEACSPTRRAGSLEFPFRAGLEEGRTSPFSLQVVGCRPSLETSAVNPRDKGKEAASLPPK